MSLQSLAVKLYYGFFKLSVVFLEEKNKHQINEAIPNYHGLPVNETNLLVISTHLILS